MKMTPTIAVRFLSALILTFWVGTALADKRVALVVGNGQYLHVSPKLSNPANDAHDLAEALREVGFDVILRTDIGKSNFDQALVEFARKAKNADTALVYYAGHGIQRSGKNYFLPTDIDNPDEFELNYLAISQDSILDAVSQAKSVKIVILDACRDNPLGRQAVASRSWGGRGLARIESAEEAIIAYATAPGRVAKDGEGRNSPFAAALIKRIKEPGLEIGTMFLRAANDVYEETNGSQIPEITRSLRIEYFLNPAESDSEAWNRVRESTDPADFKEFIRKFPTSPFAREAQFRIDLFERIRREAEEAKKVAERLAKEAERARQEESARKEAERLTIEAERKRQEEAARKEAIRLAVEAERKHLEEAAKKEAERLALEAERKHQEEAAKKEAERLALEVEKKRQEEAARKEADRLAVAADKKRQEEAAAKKDAERLDLEAEKKHQDETARKDAERLALEAEKKHQEEAAAKKEAEHLTQEAERKQKEEEARKEALRLQEEKRAAEERKVAAREEEDRRKQESELEKQRVARICEGDQNALQEFTRAQQTAAIEKLGKDTACPTLKPAIETALKQIARTAKQACDSDRKTLAKLKDSDLASLHTAVEQMSCEKVRADGQQRIARLEVELQRNQAICADEAARVNAIDKSASQARDKYAEFLKHSVCQSLRADVNGLIKKIDSRVKAAQSRLTDLGCYNGAVTGKFDDATIKSLTLYHTKKGSKETGDLLSDGLLSELNAQELGVCPAAPVIATPEHEQSNGQAKKEEEARPKHKQHKIENAAHDEEESHARPPKHKTHIAAREDELAPEPRRHGKRSEPGPHRKLQTIFNPYITRAPRMPPSPAAEAGSSHNSTVIGVGN